MRKSLEKFKFMILSKIRGHKYNLLIRMLQRVCYVELLGSVIDNQLSFKKRIAKLYQTTSYRFHALRQIRKYSTLKKIGSWKILQWILS